MSNFPKKTIGQQFAAARETKGWTLAEAARRTNLKPAVITALEADDFDKLPGVSNTRGFIRLYARELGLDGWALLRQFSGADDMPVDMLDLEPADLETIPTRSHQPASTAAQIIGLALIVAVILIALGIVGYRLYTASTFASQDPAPPAATVAPPPSAPAQPENQDNIPVAKPVEISPAPKTVPPAPPVTSEPLPPRPLTISEPTPPQPAPAPAPVVQGLRLQLLADAAADEKSRQVHVIAIRDGKTVELFKDLLPAGQAFPAEAWVAESYTIILQEASAVSIIQNGGPPQKYELPGTQRIQLPVD